MKRAIALAAALTFTAAPASADQVAAWANMLAAEQAADVAQSQSFAAGIDREGDPLARPFTHSMPVNLAAAVAINLAARWVARRSPLAKSLLKTAVMVYPFVIMHNAHEIHVGISAHTR